MIASINDAVTVRDNLVSFESYDRLAKFAEFDLTYMDQIGPLLK
jgi:hypothetical protein